MPAVIAPIRYVGNPDFHDGHVQTVAAAGNDLVVTIVGCTGSKYTVLFRSVAALEMHSPEGMTLYALGELDSETPGLFRYIFINSYADEPADNRSKARLELLAHSFAVTGASQKIGSG